MSSVSTPRQGGETVLPRLVSVVIFSIIARSGDIVRQPWHCIARFCDSGPQRRRARGRGPRGRLKHGLSMEQWMVVTGSFSP